MSKIPAKIKCVNEVGDEVWVVNIHALTADELLSDGFSVEDFDYQENPSEEMEWIDSLNETATEHGLEIEVIQFALKAMKDNPKLTPAMAMRIGYCEWVK